MSFCVMEQRKLTFSWWGHSQRIDTCYWGRAHHVLSVGLDKTRCRNAFCAHNHFQGPTSRESPSSDHGFIFVQILINCTCLNFWSQCSNRLLSYYHYPGIILEIQYKLSWKGQQIKPFPIINSLFTQKGASLPLLCMELCMSGDWRLHSFSVQ